MDNITGFGGGSDEISLGLNLNSNVSGTINDFNTLDQVLQQIVKDEETFKGIQNDSFEQAKALTQEIKSSGEQAQQLISIFRALRGEQQGSLQDAKQLASTYQQLNNELQKSVQNKTRLGITSPGASVPGSIPPTGGPGPIPGVPATQTGAGGSGGIIPPNTSPTAGFANEPDDFFGREEAKSGRRGGGGGSSGSSIDTPGIDAMDIQDIDANSLGLGGFGGGTGGAGAAAKTNEKYRQLSDLAWTIFPNRGYYRNMRRVRWLTRNEGGAINKFVTSGPGKKLGYALNRLGGGQRLRAPGGDDGYQLFPFAQSEDGKTWVDTNNNTVAQYGLQNDLGEWIQPEGGGLEGPAWNWSGEGTPPPIPPGANPVPFDPWKRPNLTATGEGAAKIAGSMYVASLIKAKAGGLFREGQLYTGITGGTGVEGALKYDLGAQLTSWFGLNPLESYGQAKQINMQNLALGYRGNLLNRANQFGNQALQKYGVDPQTSMQMFGQMVMQAGASLEDLNTSLATLANTASRTDTSFSQLQQNVIQYSQMGASIGLTGGQNATFATVAAQYAAGQPGLAATGANPADILDSMVGQALVAQQMGTSFLGLPGAAQQQGAPGVLKGEIKANEQLFGNMGITKENYQDSANYQRFKLVMASLGMKKEADMSYAKYLTYMQDMWSGKQKKELIKTLSSTYAQDLGQKIGETPSQALASAINPAPSRQNPDAVSSLNAITNEMQKIEGQNKWKNVGVTLNGKFMSLSDMEKLPYAQRSALEARIGTGDQPLSHINQHGKLIKGNYATGTYLDLQGQAPEQFNLYGRTPNRAAMQNTERNSLKALHIVELGPNAKKIFSLLEDPSAFNRYMNNWSGRNATPGTEAGSRRTSNNSSR